MQMRRGDPVTVLRQAEIRKAGKGALFGMTVATFLTRRANHIRKYRSDLPACQVPFEKRFLLSLTPNQLQTTFILSRQKGRFANVSNAGRDAMDAGGFLDERRSLRTAKPWGPGTPTLVSSLWNAISASEGG